MSKLLKFNYNKVVSKKTKNTSYIKHNLNCCCTSWE